MRTLQKFFSRKWVTALWLSLVLLAAFVCSLCIGATHVPVANVFRALFGLAPSSPDTTIVLYVRLPRTLAALGAGAALAVSGVLLQAALNNPLASSGIVGINAGSGVFTLLAAAFLPSAFIARPLFAFVGAVGAALTVYAVAAKTGAGKATILLAGIALSSLLTAVIDLLVTVFPHTGVDRIAFTVGGFAGASMPVVLPALGIIALALAGAVLLSYDLNLLLLGDEVASSVGLRTRRVKFGAILLAALLSGAAISMAGLIGFVGLIVPNLVRKLTGNDNRALLPLSAVAGAALTVLCDLIARSAFSPYELPVGILLSLLGAPVFIVLLLRGRKGGKRHAKKR